MTPTGSPDFGKNPSANNASPSFDTAEDTTRLLMGGGAQSRAGRWIWATGFEGGTMGEIIKPGAVGLVTIESGDTNVYQGVYSLKFNTLAVINSAASWSKILFTQGKNYGLEEVFSLDNLPAGTKELNLRISGPHADTGFRALGHIVLVVTGANAGDLYLDINGSRTLIVNLNNYLDDSSDFWHYWKIVFNPYTNTLSRVYFDDQVFTIDSPGYKFSSNSKYAFFSSELKTKSAAVATGYIDNIVITTDEP